MTQPFLAMIIPVAGGLPTHPIAPGGPPPTIWPNPPGQSPGNPPGFWGGTAPPMPDQGLPGKPPGFWGGVAPPYPDQGLPGKPPGFWGGIAPPYPDHGLPGGGGGGGGGRPPYPSTGPGFPTPPIYLPPGTLPGLKPEHPIYIPPSVGVPGFPTHPIVLPPPGSPPDQKPEVLANWDVKTAWSEQTGWIVAIVPSEEHPGAPTPSQSREQ
jgi:hypothetical protein